MVLFAFGPDANSWFIGNNMFTAHQNLPDTFADGFRDKSLTAQTIKWGSIGPKGLCCFLLTNDTINCNTIPNLMADLKPTNLFGISIQPVDHVTFSPGGGWVVRYNDGRVRLSMSGSFPASFYNLAGPYLQMSGSNTFTPQHSLVQYVFFGADDAVLIQLTNKSIIWANIPESLATEIRAKVDEGWTLSKNSTLCQWNKDYYFMEWTRCFGMQTSCSWRIQPNGILTDVLIREVVEGQFPVSHTVHKPPPAPPIRPSPQAVEDYAIALYDYSACEKDEIDLKEDEYITNIESADADADWWRGQNHQGKVGLFPRTYVKLVSDDDKISGPKITALHQLQAQPPNAVSSAWITCDGCHKSVTGLHYHCALCNSDNFDLCQNCFDIGVRCSQNHQAIKRTTALYQPGVQPPSAITPAWVTCDSCSGPVTDPYYHCGICNGDNFDLCQTCFDVGKWCFKDHPVIQRNLQNASLFPGTSSPLPPHQPSPPSKSKSEETKDAYAKELEDALEGTVVSENPNVRWDDVAGLEQAKEELQASTVLPLRFPQLFTGNRKSRKAILLYGPPGTGKSFLAKAVATEVECTLFSISSSDIVSKWMGESERLVKTLFELARKRKPSIIFIDEIEALCGSREAEAGEHSARMKTEFLVQMEGVGRDSSGVLVLAATNLPWKLDSAIRRRFQRRIHISLPDQKARARMFEIAVGDTPCELQAEDYASLGRMTEGFSGSDISIAVQEALMLPVKKIHNATHYRKVDHNGTEKLTPSEPHERGAIAMSWRQVPAHKLLEPPLLASDFFNVLHKVKPSVSEEDIKRNREWTTEFGSEGA